MLSKKCETHWHTATIVTRYLQNVVKWYAKQKHPGCKKCETNQKQSYKRPKRLISRKAKKLKLLIANHLLDWYTIGSIQGIFTSMVGFVTWPPLYIVKMMVQKRWPSDKANHTCENTLYTTYCISFKSKICIRSFNFLAFLDIECFGRL